VPTALLLEYKQRHANHSVFELMKTSAKDCISGKNVKFDVAAEHEHFDTFRNYGSVC
jgi:hypothetical protein